MVARCFLAALALVLPVTGVQVPDLQNWFSSANGLNMLIGDAAQLANKEAGYLTTCGVTVAQLQGLRDTLYLPSQLGMMLSDVRSNLLPLAYQHAVPADLNSLYQTLYSPSGVNLPRAQAQSTAIGLAIKHVEPYLMGPLFSVLYSPSAINLPRSQAQQMAIDLTAAGADANTLKTSYLANVQRMSKDAALKAAVADAVDANLQGLPTRYSKDGKAYVAKEFQQYYGDAWLTEWQAAVQEKRTAPDGIDYLASEYLQYFGSSWVSRWQAAPIATLRRLASDGKIYTLDEFEKFYSTAWQTEWWKSYEVLDLCAGLTQATCVTQARCQWKPTGDWTTSCVVKPLAEKVEKADLVV